jgi:hypothetical protein
MIKNMKLTQEDMRINRLTRMLLLWLLCLAASVALLSYCFIQEMTALSSVNSLQATKIMLLQIDLEKQKQWRCAREND